MRSAIVIFPGTNREQDMSMAIRRVFGSMPYFVWHQETSLPKVDLVVLPGGFAFGDYLRSGAIAAHSPIVSSIRGHVDSGGLLLGVCNGFQVMTESGILPGALVRNITQRFVCRHTWVKIERFDTPFTRSYDVQNPVKFWPVAHMDGNYVADSATISCLESEGRVLFRYCNSEGSLESGNFNGSMNNIAGILNKSGNALGMMPHVEDAINPRQSSDGTGLFESIMHYFK